MTTADIRLVAQEAADMLAEGWMPGKWEGHSTRKGKHTPNHARVWEAWDIRRSYLRKKYGQEPDLEYVDQGVADRRREDDESRSYGRNGGPRRRTRVGPDTYVPYVPRPKFKAGQRVCDLDGARPGAIVLTGNYDEVIGGYRYKVAEDQGARIWHNETNMKLIPRR